MARFYASPIGTDRLPFSNILVYRARLKQYSSEEGHQTEFVVEATTKEQVEEIIELWITKPKLVRSIAFNVLPFADEETMRDE